MQEKVQILKGKCRKWHNEDTDIQRNPTENDKTGGGQYGSLLCKQNSCTLTGTLIRL